MAGLRRGYPLNGAARSLVPDADAAFLFSVPCGAYRSGMKYRDRTVIEPTVRFGKPCVRGTRITVGDVLSYLASGMREQDILADFPQLTSEGLRACLAFAAERERRVVSEPAG